MSKFEKRLVVVALVFVAIYLGAAALTIHTRITKEDKIERFESPELTPAEGQLLIAELFLPFMILFTLTICFIIVRKQRAKKLLKMEAEDEMEEEDEAHGQESE
jgi:flagellar biosynthesis/type III secretory pathway M-ring protein FliF/YscJ